MAATWIIQRPAQRVAPALRATCARRAHPMSSTAALLCSLFAATLGCARPALAQSKFESSAPPTFAYEAPASANYVRGLLELGGFVTFGFIWYVTQTDIAADAYDVSYSWPVFRKKLSGEALELDTNELGTNYVGHPIGGAMYYTAMRSNQLSVTQSFAVAVGGSLLWEYFGEVHEIVSLNDMIVTPIAGLAIAEPLIQLGAFFDRGSPNLPNRILGTLFAPLKTLNDLLDGRTLARSADVDGYGFARGEWHQFDLRLGAATTQQRAADGTPEHVFSRWRLSLSSALVRLPDYADAGEHSFAFDDAHVSSIDVRLGGGGGGLADLDVSTQVALLGQYQRSAERHRDGSLWGHGELFGLTVGYRYLMHDYDRDGERPRDRIGSVQPLGVLFDHVSDLGELRVHVRADAGGEFAGVRPYALRAYRAQNEGSELTTVLQEHLYYFAIGGHALASLDVTTHGLEAQASARLDGYSAVGASIAAWDHKGVLQLRLSWGIPHTPLRLGTFVERHWRSGYMAHARAERIEDSVGMDLGARF